MTQSGQTDQTAILELSLEEMEKISGGNMTIYEFMIGEAILLKAMAAGGLHIYTGPLR